MFSVGHRAWNMGTYVVYIIDNLQALLLFRCQSIRLDRASFKLVYHLHEDRVFSAEETIGNVFKIVFVSQQISSSSALLYLLMVEGYEREIWIHLESLVIVHKQVLLVQQFRDSFVTIIISKTSKSIEEQLREHLRI